MKIIFKVFFLLNITFTLNLYSSDDAIYKKLLTDFNNSSTVEERKKIATKYLALAKKEKNPIRIKKGYYLMANSIEELTSNLAIKYADSMIIISEKIHQDTILKSYNFKANLLAGLGKNNEALNLFFKIENETTDLDLKYHTKLMIAQIRMDEFLEVDESIATFKECENYFKNKNDYSYIITINSLAEAYLHSRKYSLAKKYAVEGLKTKNLFFKTRFKLINALIKIETSNYNEGIVSLKTIIPELIKNGDEGNISLGYCTLGNAFLKIGNKDKAVTYYEKVDSIYQKNRIISPSFITGYNFLVDYYAGKNSVKERYYLKTNLAIEKELQRKYKSSYKKLKEEYDLPNALQKKESEIAFLKQLRVIIFSFLMLLSIIILYLYFKTRKYKKAFKKVYDLSQEWKKKPYLIESNHQDTLDIDYEMISEELKSIEQDSLKAQVKNESLENFKLSEETIADLKLKFENFENKKAFLKTSLTIQVLAKLFKTNSKYISLYVNEVLGKSFTEYLNDLRIEYAVITLQANSQMRNYTITALANEFGYLSKTTFINAFERKTGVKPSFYINEIKKIYE